MAYGLIHSHSSPLTFSSERQEGLEGSTPRLSIVLGEDKKKKKKNMEKIRDKRAERERALRHPDAKRVRHPLPAGTIKQQRGRHHLVADGGR